MLRLTRLHTEQKTVTASFPDGPVIGSGAGWQGAGYVAS